MRDLPALDLRVDRLARRAEERCDLIGGEEKRQRGERRCLRHVRPPAIVVARVAEVRRGSGSGSGSGARTRETRRLRRTARATRRGRARTTRRGDRRGRRPDNFEKPANRCPKARAVMARSRSLCSGSGAFSSKTSGAARISSSVARASSPCSIATRTAFATIRRSALRRRGRPQNPSSIVKVSSAQPTPRIRADKRPTFERSVKATPEADLQGRAGAVRTPRRGAPVLLRNGHTPSGVALGGNRGALGRGPPIPRCRATPPDRRATRDGLTPQRAQRRERTGRRSSARDHGAARRRRGESPRR